MERYLKANIAHDLHNKIVIITGPRQSGKTTISKTINPSFDYLNADVSEDVIVIKQKKWDRNKHLVIFDELHKITNWKKLLKGVFDKEGTKPELLVTGSAKLDTYKKVGDSLAGRYFQFRFYPLDLHELKLYWDGDQTEAFARLMNCSGFPEPFLTGSVEFYKRWQKTHHDIILRQDLIDYETVKDIKSIEILVELLRKRVSAGISYANIARDLERDPNTVKRWCEIVENMYIVFRVVPYHQNIARSLLKEPKFYFFDVSLVKEEGARLENLVAFSLLKHLHWLQDTKGHEVGLYYCRTKDHQEIDFMCIIEDRKYLIEVKTTDSKLSPHFAHFKKFHPDAKCVQLVLNLEREYTYPDGAAVTSLIHWLSDIDLNLI